MSSRIWILSLGLSLAFSFWMLVSGGGETDPPETPAQPAAPVPAADADRPGAKGPLLGDAVTDWWAAQKEKNRKLAERNRRGR